MRYEEFFSPADVAAYKRVKRGSMRLAGIARQIVAEMTGGQIEDGGRSAKEFLHTQCGKFRLSLRDNSDNTTEQAAHRRMGVTPVVMDESGMLGFFRLHGLDPAEAYSFLYAETRRRLDDEQPPDQLELEGSGGRG
jgi:hypothetical protein